MPAEFHLATWAQQPATSIDRAEAATRQAHQPTKRRASYVDLLLKINSVVIVIESSCAIIIYMYEVVNIENIVTMSTYADEDYNTLTFARLKQLRSERQISTKRMEKIDLIQALTEYDSRPQESENENENEDENEEEENGGHYW